MLSPMVTVRTGTLAGFRALAVDKTLVAAIVGSRLIVLVAVWLAEHVDWRNPALTSGSDQPILRSLTSWDGWWYLGIARDGYHAAPLAGAYHDYAFLPFFPALVRILSLPLPGADSLIAVLVSNVLFVVGLVLLLQLGNEVLGDDRARQGVILLALFPFGAVFSMAYAESLFLVLSVGAFLAAEHDRRRLAGVLVGLAALTRLQGAILAAPIWLIWFLSDGRRVKLNQWPVLLGPIVALAFIVFVSALAGGVGAYGAAQGAWGRAGIGATGGSDQALVSMLSPVNLAQFAVLLVAVFVLVYLRADRLRAAYAVLPPLYLVQAFASGSLLSIGRYVMLAFPNVWLLAGRRARWFRLAWPVGSAALLFGFSLWTFAGWWGP
jgi:hypothetical protein